MMDHTEPFFRAMQRVVSQRALLYTEMHVSNSLIHMEQRKLRIALGRRCDSATGVAMQIGGADPAAAGLAAARIWAEGYRFDELNINCGCPSERTAGAGQFGAALMDDPETVAAMARALAESTQGFHGSAPPEVTVKCRLGIARPSQFEGARWHVVGDNNATASNYNDEDDSHERGSSQQSPSPSPSPSSQSPSPSPSPSSQSTPPSSSSSASSSASSKKRMLQFFGGEAPPDFAAARREQQFAKLCQFVRTVSETAPVTHFVVHAREAVRALARPCMCSILC